MKTYDRRSFQRRDGSTILHAIPQRFRCAIYDNASGMQRFDVRKLYYFASERAAIEFGEAVTLPDYGGFSVFDRTTRRYLVPRPARRS